MNILHFAAFCVMPKFLLDTDRLFVIILLYVELSIIVV